MQTLIAVPTYNEVDNLEKLISRIFAALPHTDILIIDDNSPDGTGKLAQALSKKSKQIKLIQRKAKLGLGSAYIQGFKYALANNYDFVLQMDADLSHSPEYLAEFFTHACEGSLILGSRYIKGGGVQNWGTWRRLLSYWANVYARVILGLPYRDLTGGFKCFSCRLLKDLQLDTLISEGYVFQIETTYRAHRKGYTIIEIPIVFQGRRTGKSKISRKICLEAIWKVPLLRLARI